MPAWTPMFTNAYMHTCTTNNKEIQIVKRQIYPIQIMLNKHYQMGQVVMQACNYIFPHLIFIQNIILLNIVCLPVSVYSSTDEVPSSN